MKAGKFVLVDSEDYLNGKSLIMKLGELSKPSYYDCSILIWEVQEEDNFAIIEAKNSIFDKTYPIDALTLNERRMLFRNLLNYGIIDET